jgi:hypothetical protein
MHINQFLLKVSKKSLFVMMILFKCKFILFFNCRKEKDGSKRIDESMSESDISKFILNTKFSNQKMTLGEYWYAVFILTILAKFNFKNPQFQELQFILCNKSKITISCNKPGCESGFFGKNGKSTTTKNSDFKAQYSKYFSFWCVMQILVVKCYFSTIVRLSIERLSIGHFS